MTDSNSTHKDPQSIVSAFANYFQSVYKVSVDQATVIPDSHALNVNIPPITTEDILDASKTLKNKLTSGPDGIPSFLVRDCSFIFCNPLCHLYNLILTSGIFPKIWKVAKVCPIVKKGDVSVIENYRPISILCNFSKIFEAIIHKLIFSLIRNRLSTEQHGFFSQRSCVSNLSCFSQYVCMALNDKSQVDVVYTDFSKAFDQIDHYILIEKASKLFGFSNILIKLLKSYILDRRQFVEVEGFRSGEFVPSSGVPQGSSLGPLLFSIFIDDLISKIEGCRLAYADDLKIYGRIDSETDCLALQSNIDIITEWCSANRLNLNVSKCSVCSYHRIKTPFLFDYSINGTTLERSQLVKDLGVVFDVGFTFVPHVEQVVASAFKMLGFLIRNCKYFSNIFTLKLLFYSLVRSRLEYGSLVWYPIYDCHVRAIESVQRRFLKYLIFREDGTYPARGLDHTYMLHRFKILPLSLRRDLHSVRLLFNLLHNKVDAPLLLREIPFLVPRIEARYRPVFSLSTARSNILYQSPIFIMCNNFNLIAAECDIHFDSLKEILIRFCETFDFPTP